MGKFIDETAKILNSKLGDNIKCFKGVRIEDCILDEYVSIGDDCTIERTELGKHIAINRRNYINDSIIGEYSYTGINTIIQVSKIGKFCSIARNVDIGGIDHDYRKITTMMPYRFNQMKNGGGKLPSQERKINYCMVGNDVWIGAGAQVLHKVTVGDGAVIGGGAVVTHDVPPYAIVAGVPARIIGYRCDKKYIDELLEVKWWNWPENTIVDNMERLMEMDINEESIEWMKSIKYKL